MKTIFSKNSFLGLRTIGLIFLAILLMVCDRYVPVFSAVKSALLSIVAPIQYVVSKPITVLDSVISNIESNRRLLKENEELRTQQLFLQTRVQKLLMLEQENAKLRGLVNFISPRQERFLIAQLLAINVDDLSQKIVLDKGRQDEIYIGQPVLDAYGLIGQVILTSFNTSVVLMLTDSKSAIPVQVVRNGVRSIVVGTGSASSLELIHVQETVDIKRGDILVTSSLGGRFPDGYPIGIVTKVERGAGEHFMKILVTPSAHINQTRQVLLTWPVKTVANKVKLDHKNKQPKK